MKKQSNFCPLEINILMHIHAVAEPYWNPSQASEEYIAKFIGQGIVLKSDVAGSGYTLTDKGYALVCMILSTPMPMWADPRKLREL